MTDVTEPTEPDAEDLAFARLEASVRELQVSLAAMVPALVRQAVQQATEPFLVAQAMQEKAALEATHDGFGARPTRPNIHPGVLV